MRVAAIAISRAADSRGPRLRGRAHRGGDRLRPLAGRGGARRPRRRRASHRRRHARWRDERLVVLAPRGAPSPSPSSRRSEAAPLAAGSLHRRLPHHRQAQAPRRALELPHRRLRRRHEALAVDTARGRRLGGRPHPLRGRRRPGRRAPAWEAMTPLHAGPLTRLAARDQLPGPRRRGSSPRAPSTPRACSPRPPTSAPSSPTRAWATRCSGPAPRPRAGRGRWRTPFAPTTASMRSRAWAITPGRRISRPGTLGPRGASATATTAPPR